MFTIIKFNLTCKTKLKYAYYELNYEMNQNREYSSLSLSILVCNYLLHQAHKELHKRIELEMTEHTSVEVLLSKYLYGMELRRCKCTKAQSWQEESEENYQWMIELYNHPSNH